MCVLPWCSIRDERVICSAHEITLYSTENSKDATIDCRTRMNFLGYVKIITRAWKYGPTPKGTNTALNDFQMAADLI